MLCWRTILIGGLRKGGQGYFAIDITDPGIFTKNGGRSAVLWEFSDQDHPDMGFSYGRPAISRMANGEWAAVLPNGYNSTVADGAESGTGNSVLFVVNALTGQLIQKLDSGFGTAEGRISKPNGMAEPAVVDSDFNGIADTIYAGDVFGRFYGFDVSQRNAASWSGKFEGKPMFTVPAKSGYQPSITTRPVAAKYPREEGVMVYFGTGRNLEQGDRFDASYNSLFGIVDIGQKVSASELVTVTLKEGGDGWQLETPVSADTIDDTYRGWSIPLPESAAVVGEPIFQFGELSWLFHEYDSKVCEPTEGVSNLLTMEPVTGGSIGRDIFKDADGTAIRNGETIIDGTKVEGLLLGQTLMGTESGEVLMCNINDGVKTLVQRFPVPVLRQNRWRRIHR